VLIDSRRRHLLHHENRFVLGAGAWYPSKPVAMGQTKTKTNQVRGSRSLRRRIVASLIEQGFRVSNSQILPPMGLTKDGIRALHAIAVAHRRDRSKNGLVRQESVLLSRLACGPEINPQKIHPKLVEVSAGTDDELLFRYATLHWSIPVSSGYGRRLRFLIIDEQNEKLIGVLGLGDPVFSLLDRDAWIGWTANARRDYLRNVMDAFVLGAVPPYTFLLCGKLVAMLATSNEVRRAFKKKYGTRRSTIRRKRPDARLALITTTSALGRSSIYNRMSYDHRLLALRVGTTRGSGEFHFSNGLYGKIFDYAVEHCVPTAKKSRWGTGFRNRREVIKKCLGSVGISTEWLYHGIRREVYAMPLAKNTCEFLRGEHQRLRGYDHPAADLFIYFQRRWLLPRSGRDQRFRAWGPESWRLWNEE